jgi:phospholipase C
MKELQMLTHDFPGKRFKSRLLSCAAACALVGSVVAPINAAVADDDTATLTPIKHIIIIIGENRTFDHVFATYTPANKRDTVLNLLSQKIVNADGTPGPEYDKARQSTAKDGVIYELSPGHRNPYKALPPALSGGPSTPFGCQVLGITTGTSCVTSANIEAIKKFENGLDDGYYKFMLTGATGQKSGMPDARIMYDGKDASHLPPGPYQITNSETYPYDAYAASPVHRSIRCGSSSIATPTPPVRPTARAADRICFPGSKSRSAPVQTARRSRPASPTRPPARARRRWASSTSSKATSRTSRSSPTLTR